jgi:hypothetical protein
MFQILRIVKINAKPEKYLQQLIVDLKMYASTCKRQLQKYLTHHLFQ